MKRRGNWRLFKEGEMILYLQGRRRSDDTVSEKPKECLVWAPVL
jgi:hypothetical protein